MSRTPIGNNLPFYMLIETSGSNETHDEEKMKNFLEVGMGNGEICDGIVTSEPSKVNEIWKLREQTPIALMRDGHLYTYDISVPLRRFYEIVPVMEEKLKDMAYRVTGFGHLGDSNLHLNITSREYSTELLKVIEPFAYEYTSGMKGSVSSEHGLGFLKKKYIKYSKSQNTIDMMKEIKKLMDPNGILNPYKVLEN